MVNGRNDLQIHRKKIKNRKKGDFYSIQIQVQAQQEA